MTTIREIFGLKAESNFESVSVSDLYKLNKTSELFYILDCIEKIMIKKNQSNSGRATKLIIENVIYLKLHCAMFTMNYYKAVLMIEHYLGEYSFFATSKHNSNSTMNIKALKLRQLLGHAEQNCSMIENSTTHILKAINYSSFLSKADANKPEVMELKFESYDRMRKNSLYKGELEDAYSYLSLSKENIGENENNKILVKLGEAEIKYIKNPKTAFKLWKQAEEYFNPSDNERLHLTYRLLKQQEAILLYPRGETEESITSELDTINRKAKSKKYVGPWPKVPLLQGVLMLKMAKVKESIEKFNDCYDKAEELAYGIFLWLSLNNKAIALWRLGQTTGAIASFKAAISKAQRQGFLNYLNSEDELFFQNALIYNALKCSEEFEIHDFKYELLKILEENSLEPKNITSANDIFKDSETGAYLMTFI